jgi:hypothetical protein
VKELIAKNRRMLRLAWGASAVISLGAVTVFRPHGDVSRGQLIAIIAALGMFAVAHLILMYDTWFAESPRSILHRMMSLFFLLLLAGVIFVFAALIRLFVW